MNPTSEKPICAITGTRGYVGSCLKRYFEQHGWEVRELTRRPDGARSVAFQLGSNLPSEAFAGATAVVHCAYDFTPVHRDEIRAVNVDGARKVIEAARAAQIKRIVCISSIAAYPECRSLYGQAKLEIEKIALENGALAVRPGLVYGDHPQAMFGKLVEQVRKSAVLPIIGGGSIQFLVHSEDLAAFSLRFAEGKVALPPRPVTAAHEQSLTFRELLLEIGRGLNRNPRFFPLPWRAVWAGLKAAEIAGLRLKFRSDSLIGLMYPNPRPDFSLNAAAGLVCRPLQIQSLKL